MPHISVQVEPIAHVGAAACECKKVGIPGQTIFCNSLLKAARQTNSHLTLSSKRAAPGIEPGTSRTRSENHATDQAADEDNLSRRLQVASGSNVRAAQNGCNHGATLGWGTIPLAE